MATKVHGTPGRAPDGKPSGGKTPSGKAAGGAQAGKAAGGSTAGGKAVGGKTPGGKAVGGRTQAARTSGGARTGGRPAGAGKGAARAPGRRERARQAARRRTQLWTAAGGLVIVGLLVAIVVALVHAAGNHKPTALPSPTAPVVAPSSATDGGAILVGSAAAPVTVDIYLDFMCPYCGRFDRANGNDISRLVTDGTAKLKLHPLAFLDKASSGTRYSTRAAVALVTVAERAPDKVLAFTSALYAHQPEENSKGLTDDQIAQFATGAGVPQDVVSQFATSPFGPWVAAQTQAAFDGVITGTPTVMINGKQFQGDLYSAGPLAQAVTAAKGR